MATTTVKQHVAKRPTGITASLASAVVVILKLAGLDITVEEAAIIIGGLSSIVSYFHPNTGGTQ